MALPLGDHRDDLTLAAMASDAGVRRVRNDIQIRDLEQP
jgi:hypothetical protein